MEKPSSLHLELEMLHHGFSDKHKKLVREVYQMFPHMAEILLWEIIKHIREEVQHVPTP